MDEVLEFWLYPEPAGKQTTAEQLRAAVFVAGGGHLWHCGAPKLARKDLPVSHFYGHCHFAENADDEWLALGVLYELSKQFDVVIRTRDGDGEPLLIEAADHLPPWISPETSVNRVFIYDGRTHIIPLEASGGGGANGLCGRFPRRLEHAADAVKLVRMHKEATRADGKLHEAIVRRVSLARAESLRSVHRTSAHLPLKVAALLEHKPDLVSSAVRAFYLRDNIDLKACRQCQHTGPVAAGKLRRRRVRMTRHLYAMLAKQHFRPDRRSPWHRVMPDCNSELWAQYDIGHKLSCGVEMLCASVAGGSGQPAADAGHNTVECRRFMEALCSNGYFQGEKTGSKKHQKLTEEARRFFHASQLSGSLSNGRIMVETLQAVTEQQAADLKDYGGDSDDDASWLNVTQSDMADHTAAVLDNGATAEEFARPLVDFVERGRSSLLHGVEAHQQPPTAPPRKHKRKKAHKKGQGQHKGPAPPPPAHNSHQQPAAEPARPPQAGKGRDDPPPPPAASDAFGASMRKLIEMERLALEPHEGHSSDTDSYGDERLGIDLHESALREASSAYGAAMRGYMRSMDDELEATALAHSFMRPGVANRIVKPADGGGDGDGKVQGKAGGAAKERRGKSGTRSPGGDSIDLEEDLFTPVDIDGNLVGNMLKSIEAGGGGGQGPAQVMLGALKVGKGGGKDDHPLEVDSDDLPE